MYSLDYRFRLLETVCEKSNWDLAGQGLNLEVSSHGIKDRQGREARGPIRVRGSGAGGSEG